MLLGGDCYWEGCYWEVVAIGRGDIGRWLAIRRGVMMRWLLLGGGCYSKGCYWEMVAIQRGVIRRDIIIYCTHFLFPE